MKNTPTWRSWMAMRSRCNWPKCNGFKNYGGRGIKVCKRWQQSFVDFLEDMGERPIGKQLGRIDNSKGYHPGNCEWQTRKRNMRDRRNTKWVLLHGRRVCLAEAVECLKVKKASLEAYVRRQPVSPVDVSGVGFTPRKKLTAKAVREIRASHLAQRPLARKFGVSRNLIRLVQARKVWQTE